MCIMIVRGILNLSPIRFNQLSVKPVLSFSKPNLRVQQNNTRFFTTSRTNYSSNQSRREDFWHFKGDSTFASCFSNLFKKMGASLLNSDDNNLKLSALITFSMQSVFFAIASWFRFDKVTDFAGGSNFIVLAITSLVLSGTYHLRQIVATSIVVAWGARLSGYLLYRIIKIGEDHRFDNIRDDFLKFGAFWLFQAIWVMSVSLPVLFLNSKVIDPKRLHFYTSLRDPAAIIGMVLMITGLLIQALADQQKFAFRNDSSNKDKWCDIGLWQYSRHPNYCGELMIWWGMFVFCSPILSGWRWSALWSPSFITLLLLFVSGLPLQENSAENKFGDRSDFREYKRTTSPIWLFPNSWYGDLPNWIKKIFFFEYDMYHKKGESALGSKKEL